MKILVLGPGAREHAIVTALLAENADHDITVAPGNAGIALDVPCINIDANDPDAAAALADQLGIERWAAVVGGSMGGQRALEWAVAFPERVPCAVIVACGARATAEEIALCSLQVRAIRADPCFCGGDYYDAAPGDGPWRGMSLARGIGQVSYRSEIEFDERFGRGHQGDEQPLEGGRYAIE